MSTQNQTFDQACREIALEIAEVVIEKHKDYGPDNILIFKQQGLVVRMWDKIGRLKNLLWVRHRTKRRPRHESIEDSFKDLAGYGIIGLMLERGSFTNSLEVKKNGKG